MVGLYKSRGQVICGLKRELGQRGRLDRILAKVVVIRQHLAERESAPTEEGKIRLIPALINAD